MLAQKQLFLHRPPDTYGDCHRTAIACLLDVPCEHVPNWGETYWDDSAAFNEACDQWLMKHFKLKQFHLAYRDDLETVLNSVEALNPGCLFLLCGLSKNNVAHTVVAGSGKIVWDPSRDNSGIQGPIEGLYWITLLVPHYHYAPHYDEQAPISEAAWNSLRPRQGQ